MPFMPAFGAALAHVFGWRFLPPAWAAALSGAMLLVVAGSWILRGGRRPGWWPVLIALLAGLTVLAGFSDTLWPCSLSCDNGAFYQELWGIPLLLPAALCYLGFAAGAFIERARPQLGPLCAAGGWLLLGVSVYFLHLSWRLDMVCSHCLAIHGLVLALLPALLPTGLRPAPALGSAALAFCGLHLLYHPGIVDDNALPPPPQHGADPQPAGHRGFFETGMGTQAQEPRRLLLRDAADAGRSFGNTQAPFRLDVVFRFECSHCAASLGQLYQELRPLIDAGRLRLRFIAATLSHDSASRDRAHLAYAAAAQGRFLPVFLRLLGSERIRDAEGNRARLIDLDAADAIIAATEQHVEAWKQLAEDDLRRARISQGQTPRLHLYEHEREAKRWIGREDVPGLMREIRAVISAE